jgi:hypothetical protein
MTLPAPESEAVRPLGIYYETRVTFEGENAELDQRAERPIVRHEQQPDELPERQDSPSALERQLLKFYRQNLARQLMPDERVGICLRHVGSGHKAVDVTHHAEGNKASFRNLMTCGSVWHCPVCAERISEQRAAELRQAVMTWTIGDDAEGFVSLNTYTMRHVREQSLSELLTMIREALRRFKSGKGYQTLKDRAGIVGTVTAFEVTYGRSGWHVHFHELVFHQPISSSAWNKHVSGSRKRWLSCLEAVGAGGLEYVAFDARAADVEVYEYIAKFGRSSGRRWTIDRELAKSAAKKGRKDSLTPIALLDLYGDGDELAGRLWQEYALTMKSRQQLNWSRGLRALLGMSDEIPDTDIAAADDKIAAVVLGSIDRDSWRRLMHVEGRDMRIRILEVASAGNVEALKSFLSVFSVTLIVQSIEADNVTERPTEQEYALSTDTVQTFSCSVNHAIERPIERKTVIRPDILTSVRLFGADES